MALLTSHSNANKVTTEALCVRYQLLGGTTIVGATVGSNIWWHVRRFATKQYRYVGMTYAAAIACRDAKILQYTRTKKVYAYAAGVGYSEEAAQTYQADIKAVHDSGDMWHVEIHVNETDEVYKELMNLEALPSLSSLFSDITTDYDED